MQESLTLEELKRENKEKGVVLEVKTNKMHALMDELVRKEEEIVLLHGRREEEEHEVERLRSSIKELNQEKEKIEREKKEVGVEVGV